MLQRLIAYGKPARESGICPAIGPARLGLIGAHVLLRPRNRTAQVGHIGIVVAEEIVRTFPNRIYGGFAILGLTQHNYRRLGGMLIEMAYRCQTLSVGKKKV